MFTGITLGQRHTGRGRRVARADLRLEDPVRHRRRRAARGRGVRVVRAAGVGEIPGEAAGAGSAELLKTARRMRPDLQIASDAVFIAPPPAGTPVHGGMAHAPARGIGFLGLGEIFRGSLKFITPLLWICFITTLMANFFLNSWIPLILESNGLTPKEAAFASAGYHVGGTVGGVLVSLLLNRYGYSAIVALFVLAPVAIFSMGLDGNSHAMITMFTWVAGVCGAGRAVRQQRVRGARSIRPKRARTASDSRSASGASARSSDR